MKKRYRGEKKRMIYLFLGYDDKKKSFLNQEGTDFYITN